MPVMREKLMVKMRMEAEAKSHSRTDVSIRGLVSVIDEPLERGGTNLGMSPTETLISALLSCTSVISHKIARRMGIEIASMNMRAEVDFDRRGVTLAEDVAVPFPAITMTIDVTTAADAAQMDQLRRELAMYCPIAKVIRAAGTELTEVWNVHRD